MLMCQYALADSLNRLTFNRHGTFLLYDMKLIDWFILIVLGWRLSRIYERLYQPIGCHTDWYSRAYYCQDALCITCRKIMPNIDRVNDARPDNIFMAIWVVVPVLFGMVGMFLTKTMDVILLGWVNKSLEQRWDA